MSFLSTDEMRQAQPPPPHQSPPTLPRTLSEKASDSLRQRARSLSVVSAGSSSSPASEGSGASGLLAHGSPQKLRPVPSSGISPRRKPVPTALDLGGGFSTSTTAAADADQFADAAGDEPPSPTVTAQIVRPSPSMPYSIIPLSSYASSSGSSQQRPRPIPRSSSHSLASATAPASYEPSVPRQRSLGTVEIDGRSSSTFASAAATPSTTSRNTPSSSSAFPMTPDPPSPSNIDRRGLVGVGELATPRWSHSNSSGPSTSWSQPHAWHNSGGVGSASWDSRAVTGERNRSWGELASEALADAQSADSFGLVRTGKSESHLLGQHARGLTAGPDRGLGLEPQAENVGVSTVSPPLHMPPPLLSSYNLKRDQAAAEEAKPTPVSPLTTTDTASSFFAPAPESAKTYAAGLLAADAVVGSSSTTTPPTMTQVPSSSSSPRTHRRRPSDQFKLSFGATEAESKAPLREQSAASGPDLLPWERQPQPSEAQTSNSTPRKSPTVATPSSISESGGRKSRERRHSSSKPTTPSSPGHDIVRQFSASHDFSHLPPSPSSSSIQRYIRQNSVSNLSAASAAAAVAAGSIPAVPSLTNVQQPSLSAAHSTPPYPVTPPTEESRRQSSQPGSSPAAFPFPSKRASLKNFDPDTVEALRRLDGLGRSASSVTKSSIRSGRTRASSGAADDATSVKSRPDTPSRAAEQLAHTGSCSRSSMPTMPMGPNVLPDGSDKVDANLSPRSASFVVARSSQGGSSSVSSKRGSASSTTTSPYSTAPSTNTAGTRASIGGGSGPPRLVRKSSASSDVSAGAPSDGGDSIHRDRVGSATGGRDETEAIPPVPPLPKAYDLSARSSINQFTSASFGSQAAQLSPAHTTTPPATTVLVATAPPSPSTPGNEQPMTSSVVQTPETEEVLAPLLRRGSSIEEATTDASSVTSPRRSATKKWSFSNAFNKLSSAKHSVASTDDGSNPSRSPTMPTAAVPNPPLERASPQIPWAVGKAELEGGLHANDSRRASNDSYVMPSPPAQTARRLPSNASLAPPSSGDSSTAQTPSGSGKRLTPSSIPFFRRSSSQSMHKLASATTSSSTMGPRPSLPSTPGSSATSTPRKLSSASTQESGPAAPAHRKSMLGNMGFSGMLKSSSSRRSLAAAAASAADSGSEFGGATGIKRPREPLADAGEKSSPSGGRLTSGLGLLGRRRGKTVSSQDKDKARDAIEQLQPSEPSRQTIPRVASLSRPSPSPATRSNLPRASSSSSLSSIRRQASTAAQPKSNALLRTSRAHLPTISGSPSSSNLGGQTQSFASAGANAISASSTFSRMSDATPTKIPRIASRQLGTPTSVQQGSLSRRGSETATLDSFVTGPSRAESNLSDFGTLDSSEAKAAIPAQRFRTTTAASAKTDNGEAAAAAATRRYSSITSSTSTNSFTTRPPRQLPIPPTSSSSTITAAKRLPSSGSLAEPRRLPSSSSVNSGLATVAVSGGSSLATPRTFISKYAAVAHPPPHTRMPTSSSTHSLATNSSTSRSASASPVIVDDDETIGDEEMRQFMKRQRAKRAASGATSAEIEAMMNYPDPIAPSTAKTPLAMIKAHFTDLSDYERREITEYTEVFCVGVGSKKKMAKLDDSALNHGYDDDRGDYLVVNGDHLAYRYEIMGILGKGSFGQVLQCRDHKTGEAVAVKIIRNKKRFHHQALVEVKILDNLRKWDPDQQHCVIVMTEHFYFRNHLCIATELLSINLYELIKANSFAGFTTTLIRRFTAQMLQSLILLRQHRVVHCDLKPENILLAHPAKSGIKVIDFGSSCLEHEKVYTYIQSRFYRSPEVILGCNYSQAIDMWSLGCILAELYTGFPIFPGENEQEQLSCIMEVLGLPDKYIVDKSSRKNIFFDTQGTARPVVNSKGKRRRPGTKTLSQVLKTDDELFVDFIAKCLTWDPDRRLKPMPALRHPWLVRQRPVMYPQLPATASTPSSRLSLVSAGGAPASSTSGVTGRVASSLTGTGRAKVVSETPTKKAPVIGPPIPLSARVRASNIVGSSASSFGSSGGGHVSHGSISASSTGSFRQHRASQQALTTSASARHLSVHGALTSSAKS